MDSQLVYYRCGLKPKAGILMKGVQGNVVLGFTTGDLVAVPIKCGEGDDQEDVVVCSAYFLPNSVETPPPTEFKEVAEYCSKKKLELLVGNDANAHNIVWGSLDVNLRKRVYVSISWQMVHYSKTKRKYQCLLQV